jgi:hypothetical protein
VLLVRPTPVPGEVLVDYAGRLADANGVGSSQAIYTMLRTASHGDALGGVSRVDLDDMDLRLAGGLVIWRKARFAAGDLSRRAVSVCPHCLDTSPVRPALWRFYWTVSCTRHDCLLVDRCPSCKAGLMSGIGTAKRCACGYELRRAQTCDSPDEIRAFQLLLEGAFLERAGLPRRSGTSTHPAATLIRDREGFALLRRAVVMTQEPELRPRGNSPVALEHRLARVRALAKVFRLGPISVIDKWQEAWAQCCAEQYSRGYKSGPGQCLVDLRHWCLAAPKESVLRGLGECLNYDGAQMPRGCAAARGLSIANCATI